jgi:AbrB family looped-hinge helix DNA binding protein
MSTAARSTSFFKWYRQAMSGTYTVTMGDRGRLVVPAELRERAGLQEGRPLVLVETDAGVVLLTREQLKARVRADLTGLDLVDELLAERRSAAHDEDRT